MVVHPTRMPVVFIGHGSPMNALAHNRYTETLAPPGRVGAETQGDFGSVRALDHARRGGNGDETRPRTIHDFGGFPQALFGVKYPAPGDPQLATRVRELLAPTEVHLDRSWGLDHGTWSVLVHAFPKADIPVVQLSLDITQPADFHYDLAARLAPLRDEGVLIVGSGNVVHNLGLMQWTDDAPPYDWAVRFNETVHDHLIAHQHKALTDLKTLGDDARLGIPTPEHYLPFAVLHRSTGPGRTLSFPVDGIEYGAIGMLTVVDRSANTLTRCSGATNPVQ